MYIYIYVKFSYIQDIYIYTYCPHTSFKAAVMPSLSLGLGVEDCGPEFRVLGSGFRVLVLGFRVLGSGFRVLVLGFRVLGSGFRVLVLGFRVLGSGLRVAPSRQEGFFHSLWALQFPCSGCKAGGLRSPVCSISKPNPQTLSPLIYPSTSR